MFIDEWFDRNYYKRLSLSEKFTLSFGQFFWTHAYYPHENLEFWRPVLDPMEPTKTFASKFQIQSAGQDAFRRSIPLQAPKLETNEEFLVVRAKYRPVLLIQPEILIPAILNRGFRGRVSRSRCTVAQIFGLADPQTGRAEFSPNFVDRVRQMEYPQLMFLPKESGLFQVDSLLRLDELQSVFTPHLEPAEFAMTDDIATILRDQIQFLLTGKGPNEYTLLREELLRD
ncbi:MAG: hypothetical protein KC592_19735 [Nitrospira sp.]|nr:hypothetical protein [Nitrospira sp.]